MPAGASPSHITAPTWSGVTHWTLAAGPSDGDRARSEQTRPRSERADASTEILLLCELRAAWGSAPPAAVAPRSAESHAATRVDSWRASPPGAARNGETGSRRRQNT